MVKPICVLLTYSMKNAEGSLCKQRAVTNNINKSTSVKTLQPERKTCLKPPEKPTDFLIRAHRACKRATVESQNGHSCRATVAILQARLGPFSPVFGLKQMSVKFKWLNISVLKKPPKSRIYAERPSVAKYRKHRGRKRTNSLTVIYPDASPTRHWLCRESVQIRSIMFAKIVLR